MGNAGRTVYCFDEWIYGNHLTFAEENEASQTIEQPSYISDFPNQVGHWQDLVGTAEKRMILLVYGSQTRSKDKPRICLYHLDAREQSSGDLELTFLYEGQSNFGLVFAEINKRRVNGNLLLIIVTVAGS